MRSHGYGNQKEEGDEKENGQGGHRKAVDQEEGHCEEEAVDQKENVDHKKEEDYPKEKLSPRRGNFPSPTSDHDEKGRSRPAPIGRRTGLDFAPQSARHNHHMSLYKHHLR